MTSPVTVARTVAAISLVLCALGSLVQMRTLMARLPGGVEPPPKGRWTRGVLYAFTLGMAPWHKESARLHLLAYLRGIVLHVGIFTSLAVFATYLLGLPLPSIMVAPLVVLTSIGGLAGLIAIAARVLEETLRTISSMDDYVSPALATAFVLATPLTLGGIIPLPFYLWLAAAIFLYLPFSKLRHCIYFFFCRYFFGRKFGQRAVVGHKPIEQR